MEESALPKEILIVWIVWILLYAHSLQTDTIILSSHFLRHGVSRWLFRRGFAMKTLLALFLSHSCSMFGPLQPAQSIYLDDAAGKNCTLFYFVPACVNKHSLLGGFAL
jgi:hypothetical protein